MYVCQLKKSKMQTKNTIAINNKKFKTNPQKQKMHILNVTNPKILQTKITNGTLQIQLDKENVILEIKE
jgi:hypothetical protein